MKRCPHCFAPHERRGVYCGGNCARAAKRWRDRARRRNAIALHTQLARALRRTA